MRKIRSFWARFCQWALGLLGISAAVSSCEDIIGGMKCYYGCPTMTYEVKGKVLDSETGKPVPGIKVTHYDYEGAQGILTEKDGTFLLQDSDFPQDTLHIHFKDIDGKDNGGQYAAQEVVVNLDQVQEGDGEWNCGTYAASGVTVKMVKESE